MTDSSLSVLVPNFNHAEYLRACLDSILNQSVQPQEVIVCDDGSTDESVEILESYAQKHRHLVVMKNPVNKGVNFTFNRMLAQARGAYIYSMAADDELGEGAVAAIAEVLEKHPGVGQILLRTTFRHMAGGAPPVDKTQPSWGGVVVLSAERMRAVPGELAHCLSYGVSVSVAYRKDAFADAGGYLPELGSTADIFSRLYVACKFGSVLHDTVGQIHNIRGPSYGRPGAMKGVENKMLCYPLMLSSMRKIPAVFEPVFVEWMRQALSADTERDVVKYAMDEYHHATAKYYAVLDRFCGNSGRSGAVVMLKALGLCRNALEWWLRRSFRRASRDLFAARAEPA